MTLPVPLDVREPVWLDVWLGVLLEVRELVWLGVPVWVCVTLLVGVCVAERVGVELPLPDPEVEPERVLEVLELCVEIGPNTPNPATAEGEPEADTDTAADPLGAAL